jgi:hypothetical protein
MARLKKASQAVKPFFKDPESSDTGYGGSHGTSCKNLYGMEHLDIPDDFTASPCRAGAYGSGLVSDIPTGLCLPGF